MLNLQTSIFLFCAYPPDSVVCKEFFGYLTEIIHGGADYDGFRMNSRFHNTVPSAANQCSADECDGGKSICGGKFSQGVQKQHRRLRARSRSVGPAPDLEAAAGYQLGDKIESLRMPGSQQQPCMLQPGDVPNLLEYLKQYLFLPLVRASGNNQGGSGFFQSEFFSQIPRNGIDGFLFNQVFVEFNVSRHNNFFLRRTHPAYAVCILFRLHHQTAVMAENPFKRGPRPAVIPERRCGYTAIDQHDGDAAEMCPVQNIRPDFRIDDDQHGRLYPAQHSSGCGRKVNWKIKRIPFAVYGKSLRGNFLSCFCNG